MTLGRLHEHLYLVTTLWGLLTVALCWGLAGPQRRMMLVSGAVCLPFSPLGGTYNNGSFWTPTHLEVPYLLPLTAFGGPFGIEDLLCLFIAGARAWFCATLPARRRWITTATPKVFLRRAAALSASALAGSAALRMMDVDYVRISFFVPLAVGTIIAVLRPGYWRLAVAGAIGSALLSSLELRAYFALWPEWPSAWTQGTFSGADILGVKLGDMLWWLVVGAVHPLVMAYCAGAERFVPLADAASP